jgi:hypothetical protein
MKQAQQEEEVEMKYEEDFKKLKRLVNETCPGQAFKKLFVERRKPDPVEMEIAPPGQLFNEVIERKVKITFEVGLILDRYYPRALRLVEYQKLYDKQIDRLWEAYRPKKSKARKFGRCKEKAAFNTHIMKGQQLTRKAGQISRNHPCEAFLIYFLGEITGPSADEVLDQILEKTGMSARDIIELAGAQCRFTTEKVSALEQFFGRSVRVLATLQEIYDLEQYVCWLEVFYAGCKNTHRTYKRMQKMYKAFLKMDSDIPEVCKNDSAAMSTEERAALAKLNGLLRIRRKERTLVMKGLRARLRRKR